MAESLIVLNPSEVKKSSREVLSEHRLSDSGLNYLEPGESRFKRACELSGGRIVWSVCGLIAGALGVIYSGASWKNALPGLVVGIVTLFVAWFMFLVLNYLVIAPWKMEAMSRKNLA